MKSIELALLGGRPIRNKVMVSRPKLSKSEGKYVERCLKEKNFSRFIGSPVNSYKKHLILTSQQANKVQDGWSVLGGKYVREFEAAFAKDLGVPYAISVNSATSGLITALKAAGICQGDEVITTPFTFTATATSILLAGAIPVFADIDHETFCLSRATIEKVISDRSKAVMPVHILGNAGDFSEIVDLCASRNLILVEDSCQAIRTKYQGKYLGSIGKAGVFSFQESKNIMTGEGGMIVTSSEEIAYRCRLIRNHGEALVDEKDDNETVYCAAGYNFRLPEPIAAIGRAQLRKLKRLNDIRHENYEYLVAGLEPLRNIIIPQKITHPESFFPYTAGFRLNVNELMVHRDLFAAALRAEGIPVTTGFPRILNENEIFQRAGVLKKFYRLPEKCPIPSYSSESTQAAKELNSYEYIGFFQIGYPNTKKDMDDLVAAIEKICDNQKPLLVYKDSDAVSNEYGAGR